MPAYVWLSENFVCVRAYVFAYFLARMWWSGCSLRVLGMLRLGVVGWRNEIQRHVILSADTTLQAVSTRRF